MEPIPFSDFQKVHLRVGTVVAVEEVPEIRRPVYRIEVDFGPEVGVRKTVAQVKDLYGKDELIGRQVIGLTNIPAKQVGPVMSQFLLTGFYREDGSVVLAVPDKEIPNGARLA